MSRFPHTFSYLRRHYFDGTKLRNLAIREFVKAMRSGRLIAFTGAMTTTEFKYPDWKELLEGSLKIVEGHLAGTRYDPDLIEALRKVAKRDQRFDPRVAISAVAQMLDHNSVDVNLTSKAAAEIAELYLTSKPGPPRDQSVVAALLDHLHVDRFVTTNYDLELEAYAMGLKPEDPSRPWNIWEKLVELDEKGLLQRAGGEQDGYSIVRNLANADRVVSDLMRREHSESLIEFAIGCPENDRHIFHLHGRVDQAEGLILSYRDYDRLYRRRGTGKLPFQHALRILFAGNPVLFVGLGMTEPELNQTLTEFVGDHPYVRKAPSFLIWNALPEWKPLAAGESDGDFHARDAMPAISIEERKDAFRLDKLHRLNVLTIFADDLPLPDPPLAADASKETKLRGALVSLARKVTEFRELRVKHIPGRRWRNAGPRIARAIEGERIVDSWRVDWPGSELADPDEGLIRKIVDDDRFMSVIIRPPSTGTTTITQRIAETWTEAVPDGLAITINFNMRIDTDSILAFIGDLLRFDSGRADPAENFRRSTSREEEFKSDDCAGLQSGRRLLLVLKGLERIFDVNGHPLSAEFDQFLRTAVERSDALNIRFIIIGTVRIRSYFEGLSPLLEARARATAGVGKSGAAAHRDHILVDRLPPALAADQVSPYLGYLEAKCPPGALAGANLANQRHNDYASQRRAFYRSFLSLAALDRLGVPDPDLTLELVSLMSFIGQPVEREVLFHAPSVQRLLKERTIDESRAAFEEAFAKLVEIELVKPVNGSHGKDDGAGDLRRYAVHLSLQSEIRDRNGIPLSDSILSTSYNMSLFTAQPADGAVPEARVHDELGRLIDWLVGAYKDEPLVAGEPHGDDARGAPHVVAALRAAVSLVRGLYSMSALLSVDRGDRLISEERDGLLTEHAERLDRILEAFDEMWRAREAADAKGDPAAAARPPEPLYPDELVWLHNERGVVKLAQGDLYEARFSFNEADRINRTYVEFHDESHNWRRITLNQIVVDIERGRLQSAEDRMNAIERRLGRKRADHIRKEYLESGSPRRIRFDPEARHEDILAMALVTGYRGLTSHLRGELDAAQSYFERAIRVLQRMDEQRALALFRRHKASVFADLHEWGNVRRENRLSVTGAESVRQLDIVYAGRLMEAGSHDQSNEVEPRKRGLRAAYDALDYATLADMHRLNLEAQTRLSHAKRTSGDYDAALEHVSEAMAIATRYGMTLHKIGLRTAMGRILAQRGELESGKTLIQNAINGAARIGYQRAIDSARRALSDLGS